jgi:lysophospholipase L1-like esterase
LILRPRLAAGVLLLVSACGGSKGPGPSPATEPPQLTCPGPITVTNVTGTSQTVTFPEPTVTGGTPPITTTCDRTSGSSFPLGTSSVNCTTSDAQQRTARCAFDVTLEGLSLAVKKFEAFGDSLTEGQTGQPGLWSTVIDTPNAYPTRLQVALNQQYPDQSVTVVNRGVSGDKASQTVDRIRASVPVDRPDAVLILTGFNNLTTPCPTGASASTACDVAIEQVEDDVIDAIRKAKESSPTVQFVFVSTLTPPGPSGSLRIDPKAIELVNGRLRVSVAAERAVLVDAHSAFVGHETEYVNLDGLHLRPAGYQALADAFFAAIKATIPQTPLLNLNR